MKQKAIFSIAILVLSIAFLGCQKGASTGGIPDNNSSWLKDVISDKKNSPVENPPAYIKSCAYNNNIAYYISSPCCDQFNYLYNKEGEIICAPDGGITGKGDGKCPDFSLDKNGCKTFWEDSRNYP